MSPISGNKLLLRAMRQIYHRAHRQTAMTYQRTTAGKIPRAKRRVGLGAELICKIDETARRDIDRHARCVLTRAGSVLAWPADMRRAQAVLGRRLEIVAVRRRHHAFIGLDIERLGGGEI